MKFTTRISIKIEHSNEIKVILGATPMAIEKSCLRKPNILETTNLRRPSLKWKDLGSITKTTPNKNQFRLNKSLVEASNILNKLFILTHLLWTNYQFLL